MHDNPSMIGRHWHRVSRAARRLGTCLAPHRQCQTRRVGDAATQSEERILAPEQARLAVVGSCLQPLPLRFTAKEPHLVIVVPSGRLEDIYGGLATAFNFGAAFARRGIPVRFLSINQAMDEAATIALHAFLAERCGFPSLSELIEIELTVEAEAHCHPRDIFVGTIWWSALRIFHTLAQGGFDVRAFYYFIQDYEPGFYPWSDEYALADSTYRLPCWPVVNTTFLARHLQCTTGLNVPEQRIFAPEIDWKLFHPPSIQEIEGRQRRRIFVYGRHATPRNLFGIAVLALRQFIAELRLNPNDVDAVSGGEAHGPIDLGRGIDMRSLGKMNMGDYAEMLRQCDLGLSLMLSPHPSYPPFEMAASGMCVVTNDFSTKRMCFSDNLITTNPAPEMIANALKKAWGRTSDGAGRTSAARFDLGSLGRPLDLVAADLALEIKSKLAPAPLC